MADIKASIGKAQELGGTILCDLTKIPYMGQFAVVQDSTGAEFPFWPPA